MVLRDVIEEFGAGVAGTTARFVALGIVDLDGDEAAGVGIGEGLHQDIFEDRKSTRLNSSHLVISYAVFCLKKKKKKTYRAHTVTTPSRTPSYTLHRHRTVSCRHCTPLNYSEMMNINPTTTHTGHAPSIYSV